ncbi:DUF2288 domain-containing protein [methane-oxidizing endosymbiont of Gigantopelta aegis]|uniref:DUF2288 domain-containing protein n=1 Tax=methane-oxidizing endosymbiont of Gigantopelta aegis TaxID=2794938 RepID=UPI0018DBF747|nr:DUF2288 domain-containing protein [methane-oxidizing endosymbiont of Gigantopelta aegis]
MTENDEQLLRHKINQETSKIHWSELQRFFASGLAISVAPELDLVEVALMFSVDNKDHVKQWIEQDKIGPVTDAQARQWLENDVHVWAVVVKPWILVQHPSQADG